MNYKWNLIKILTLSVGLIASGVAPFGIQGWASITSATCSVDVDMQADQEFSLHYVSASNNNGSWKTTPPSEMLDGPYTFEFKWDAMFLGTQGMDVNVVYSVTGLENDASGTVTFHVHCNVWADLENNISSIRSTCSATDTRYVSCSAQQYQNIMTFDVQN